MIFVSVVNIDLLASWIWESSPEGGVGWAGLWHFHRGVRAGGRSGEGWLRVGLLNRTIHFPSDTDLQWPVIESSVPCINNVAKTHEELGCQRKKTNTRYLLIT